jgi:hypothetical protein
MTAAERIRACLDKAWKHEQDGSAWMVLSVKDFDELRIAINEEILAAYEKGEG